MARHLAICERKSAYPSRNEAKAAIVTHSMLDVLGLVRKPEEGPSGTSKRTGTKQEPAPIEDNETSKSKDSVEEEVKKTVEESGKQAVEEVKEVTEEAKKETDKLVEEEEKKDMETVEGDEKAAAEDSEKEKDDDKEVVECENEAVGATAMDENVAEKDEEKEKIESVETEKETEEASSGRPVEEGNEAEIVESSSDPIKSPEETTEAIEETAIEASSQSEKEDSTTLTESLVESQNEIVETAEQTSIKNVEDIESVPEDTQSVAEEAEKELEVPQEPVGAREQVSPINEMETSEVMQEKATLETEITSDDIQNLISDVVGEKSNTSMGFDAQTMDDSANMETETDINVFSGQDMAARPVEDVAMNQEESMEVPDSNEVMDCEVVTPMETD